MFNMNHVAISVTNKEASVKFYKKFGFKENHTFLLLIQMVD